MFSLKSILTKSSFKLNQKRTIGLFGSALLGGLATTYYFSTKKAFAETCAFNPKEFKSFKLSKVTDVNHNTKIFTFDLESPDQPLNLPVASCIVTKADGIVDKDGKPIIRPYTPIDSDDVGKFELLVKKYEQGNMSKHLHEMKIGDVLEVKGPIIKFPYTANSKSNIGMIAGGTGLTPMLQVIKEILKNPNDKTNVSFIFANIAEEDILLRKELDELQKKHSNFKVHYVLEKPPTNWDGGVGYVSKEHIQKYLPPPSKDNLILVCGPPGMMNSISGQKAPDFSQGELSGLLKDLGYEKDQVFKF